MALSKGLHHESAPGVVTDDEREHRRRLWWSVYNLDRYAKLQEGLDVLA